MGKNIIHYFSLVKFKFRSNWLILVLALLYILLQVPFLQSDPDILSTNYGGPNTDEGLNSIQVRNYIHHGDWSMEASDNLVKTPLFAAFLYLPFKLFGTQLWVGRLSIVLGCVFLFIFAVIKFNRVSSVFGILLLLLTLFEFHVFQFVHFCLAEALCTMLIFTAIMVLNSAVEQSKNQILLLLSALLISSSYYVKIQFLYVIPILPTALLLFAALDKNNRKIHVKNALFMALYLGLFIALYVVAWYLPNKAFFEYVMSDQTNGRFAAFFAIPRQIAGLIIHLFLTKELALYFVFFAFLWIFGGYVLLRHKLTKKSFLFIATTSWIVFEAHKLLMTYHPTRYYISLIFGFGIIIALGLSHLWEEIALNKKGMKIVIVAIMVVLGLQNSVHYAHSIGRRTFEIKRANDYLAQYNLKNELVLGARAPSLVWESKSTSMPVWSGYFNDTAILAKHPRVIVEDSLEIASNHAFKKEGIVLSEIADSTRSFGTPKWNVNIYWINQKHWK